MIEPADLRAAADILDRHPCEAYMLNRQCREARYDALEAKEEYWRRENERLRAALKPFAEAARPYTPYSHGMMNEKVVSIGFTLGQIRVAADAFEQQRDGK